jgi:hypothetical protein
MRIGAVLYAACDGLHVNKSTGILGHVSPCLAAIAAITCGTKYQVA